MSGSKKRKSVVGRTVFDRIMPRHAPFYISVLAGALGVLASVWFLPLYAIGIGANAMFIAYLALTGVKLRHLTADYLHEHARDEDTPSGGIFFLVAVVVVTSAGSLFMALNGGEQPDLGLVIVGVCSVVLGWFTVQAVGALHYAYEYYQVPEAGTEEGSDDVEGGLDFPGDDRPDGSAFMYFSYTVGTSVATSDTKVTSNAMRRRVVVHLVFSHFYNTVILAAAVNVVMGLGGG